MFKRVPDSLEVGIGEVAGDITLCVVFLGGTLLIELYIRPMFGINGVPLIPNAIFTLFELGLFVKVLHRFCLLLIAFIKDMATSWVAENILTYIRGRKK